jgi:hypothetical protein
MTKQFDFIFHCTVPRDLWLNSRRAVEVLLEDTLEGVGAIPETITVEANAFDLINIVDEIRLVAQGRGDSVESACYRSGKNDGSGGGDHS